MATIIDALLVTLGLDASAFQKAQKQVEGSMNKTSVAARKTQKDLDEMARNSAYVIGKIRDQVLSLTAALLGAAAGKQFVDKLNSTDTATARLARNVNSSTSEISAWTGAAARAGGTAEGMASTISSLSGLMTKLKLTGNSEIIPFLGRAHVDPKFLSDTTSWTERLLLVADAFSKMDPATSLNLGQQVGMDDRTIAVLRNSRETLLALVEAQQKLNVVSEADADAANKRVRAYETLNQALEEIGRRILTALTPAILKALEGLTKFLEYAQQNMPATTSAVVGLTTVFAALTAIKMSGLLLSIGKLSGGLGAAGTAATGLLGTLSKLFGVLGVGAFADAGLKAIDPKDKLGSWIDKNVPGASWIDNQASKIGLGRSYAEQGLGSAAPSSSLAAAGARLPRGIRNNNPGNLNFVGQPGATRETGEGRFAAFRTMDEGVAALASQLQRYAARGNDTVRGIISKFAPPSENNTGSYINMLAKSMGVSPDQHLDLSSIQTLRSMIGGISTVENGAALLNLKQINSGLDYAMQGRYGNSQLAGGGSTTNVAKIADNIHIHTQATDAESMAREVGPKLRNYTLSAQSNNGLE